MTPCTPFPPAAIAGDVRAVLSRLGTIFADFGDDQSGCVGHGIETAAGRWFVKHPLDARGREGQHRALAIHAGVRHPALVPLLQCIEGPQGPVLVFPWVDGERLRGSRRLAEAPLAEVLRAIDAVIDVHVAIDAAGFASIDLYDGNLLYDGRIHLIDVDEYVRGPHRLAADRTPGSTRFMAPEEFCRGAVIDSRTTVFQLGRTAAVLLDPPEGRSLDRFAGLAPWLARATAPDPADRHPSVARLAADWRTIAAPQLGGASRAQPRSRW